MLPLTLLMMSFMLLRETNEPKGYEQQYSEMVSAVKENRVSDITAYASTGKVVYTLRESGEKQVCYIADISFLHDDISDFVNENNMNNKNEAINVNYKAGIKTTTLISLATTATLIFVLISVSKSIVKLYGKKSDMSDKEITFGMKKGGKTSTVKFDDIAGAEEEKEELMEVVDFLKNPKAYIDAGARIPRGTLLVGPPGTGKTLLARAVAGESEVPFYSLSGSDFVEMFVGVGAARVRSLFEQAKKCSPSIVFIDEIDAVGKRRSINSGSARDENEQTLNQLLVEMDGFSQNENVIVIAATNRPDVLDTALLRPGRFDRQITVNLPDVKGREQILKIHGKNKKFDSSVDFGKIAADIVGFSGADIENLLNEAALRAIREKHKKIKQEDIEEAMVKVVMGTEKKSLVINDKDKKITAYHEAGHAVVAYCLKTQDNVEQISIIPRGMSAGHTLFKPKTDNSHISKEYLYDRITVMLGGRVAEDVFVNDVSTGASNDIKKATETARKMVTEWGMSKASLSYKCLSDCSEETKRIIDMEIDNILAAAYKTAKEILIKNTEKVSEISEILCSKEKLSGDEFRTLMSKKNDAKR